MVLLPPGMPLDFQDVPGLPVDLEGREGIIQPRLGGNQALLQLDGPTGSGRGEPFRETFGIHGHPGAADLRPGNPLEVRPR